MGERTWGTDAPPAPASRTVNALHLYAPRAEDAALHAADRLPLDARFRFARRAERPEEAAWAADPEAGPPEAKPAATTLRCGICWTFVRGRAVVCLFCGHGFHLQHMRDWVSRGNVGCPEPLCDCQCFSNDVIGA